MDMMSAYMVASMPSGQSRLARTMMGMVEIHPTTACTAPSPRQNHSSGMFHCRLTWKTRTKLDNPRTEDTMVPQRSSGRKGRVLRKDLQHELGRSKLDAEDLKEDHSR